MQNIQNKIIVFIGVALFVCGTIILSSNYLNAKIDNAYSYMNNLLLLREEEIVEIQEEVVNIEDTTSSLVEEPVQNETVEENVSKPQEYVDPYLKYYIGKLEIPKINFSKGFTAIDSPYNTVSKNIEVVKGSNYPDQKLGNFIIAAHSGNSYLAYFKDLYQLVIGDVASVTYKNKKYTYKLVNIYEQDKTGRIVIYRNLEKTGLTLVTCTKDKKDKQTIYILELQMVENI